jgi:putative colanic acid biosynthesis UDP-glucose lipid carrier transferase
LAILIKLESKGQFFLDKEDQESTKRVSLLQVSIHENGTTETEASKNDPRVTRIGKLMRKTSVDEMPQFFKLLGDMSVVGPRPHLWSQNLSYTAKLKNIQFAIV